MLYNIVSVYGWLTITPKSSSPIRLNTHIKVASINAKTAMNAIKLAAIPTTAPTAVEAPREIASNIFLASLYDEIKMNKN